MKTRDKFLIGIGATIFILFLCVGIYFGFIYEPKNAYDVAWDIEDTATDANKSEVEPTEKAKDNKAEEVKKEPTVEEIIREVEKSKPRFNLDIQPNLVADYKDYTELKEANWEVAMVKFDFNGEIYPMTKELSEEDIKRFQEYDTPKIGAYIGFEKYYEERRDSAEHWIKSINPASFPNYKNAKVEWITDPKLVYKTAIGQRGIRGILRIQYFEEENRFKVEANKIYEIDTEIVVSETANYDNSISIKLNKILYLSNLREVK